MKIRAAIIGGSESGKTYLAMGFSRGLWRQRRWRSFVFDPWAERPWGPGAWVTRNFEEWRHVVTNTSGGVAIWDEATANGGRDRENVPLFSEIRHRHHALFCIGHAYSAILPLMRINLTDLFLSLADAGDAAEWAKVMKDPEISRLAPTLPQYAFLHKRCFRPVRTLTHSRAEIETGIIP